MTATRRVFLQQVFGSLAARHIVTTAMLGGEAAILHRASRLGPQNADLASASFGVKDGKLLDPVSYYRVPQTETAQDRLCFDVSNNSLACSIDGKGRLERLVIQVGVTPIDTRSTPVGAYVEKVLLRAGSWPLRVQLGNAQFVPLDALGQPDVALDDNLLPSYRWTTAELVLLMTVFAPQNDRVAPRALCVQFSAQTKAGPLTLEVGALAHEDGMFIAMMAHRDGTWNVLNESDRIRLGDEPVTLGLLMDANHEGIAKSLAVLRTATGPEWLAETLRFHRSHYGTLRIPAAPFFAELYTRAGELSRQSLMLCSDGSFGGSFNGSDLPAADNVWLRDCFYASLPQSFLAPELCAKAVLFLLRHSIPARPLGEHAGKFAGASGVTNSLGNSVAGIVLAGMYYQYNGATAFLKEHPEILTRSVEILEAVLASRLEEVFLFPSIYISDGESRGDFHTGSNIFLWRAFASVARLASEVYGEAGIAALWQRNATRLQEAILANCIANDEMGQRFIEGSMQDHTAISGHDGEESDVTLAAFYGFCSPDAEAYLNSARSAIGATNPYAIQELEGIWWYAHGKWSSATFPGWITGLAGSANEEEMAQHLHRIRTLTDADGAFWWWPYSHNGTLHPQQPLRLNSKCGWAAGTYLAYFTGQLLGLHVDASACTLTFRPFLPWPEMTWTDARLGGVSFDCSYKLERNQMRLTVRNRNTFALRVTLEALLPHGKKPGPGTVEGNRRYGRQTVISELDVAPGEAVNLRVGL